MDKSKYKQQAKVLFNKKRSIDAARKDRLEVSQRVHRPKPVVENKVIVLDKPMPRKPKPSSIESSRIPAKRGCKGCSRQIKNK